MTRTLTTRKGIKLFFIAGFIVLLAATYALSYQFLYRQLMEEAKLDSLNRVRFVASIIEKHKSVLDDYSLVHLASQYDVRLSYIAADGTVLSDSTVSDSVVSRLDNHKDRLEFIQAEKNGFGVAIRTSLTTSIDTIYSIIRLADGNYLRLAVPVARVQQEIDSHFTLLASLGGIILAASLLILYVQERVFRQDLHELSSMVNAIAQGNYRRTLGPVSREELQPLAQDISLLAESIQQGIDEISIKTCQLQTIFESMQEGVAIFNASGNVQVCNTGFFQLFPLCHEHGQAIDYIALPQLQASIEKILQGVAPSQYSFRHEEADGTQLFISLYEPQTPTADVRLVMLVQDVTKLLRLERSQVDFVANVSHELRTPLTAIKGYAEALSENTYSPEEGRGFARTILRHAQMLTSLIEELLDLAALDDVTTKIDGEEVDPVKCVTAAKQMVEEGEACAGRIHFTPPEQQQERGMVLANMPLLVQAIRNLLENACIYTPAEEHVVVDVAWQGASCVISVSDNGPGIGLLEQKRIFERFYRLGKQRNSSHSGLGLAIAKQIVERFDGKIWVESPSSVAKTTFYIQLPLSKYSMMQNGEYCGE